MQAELVHMCTFSPDGRTIQFFLDQNTVFFFLIKRIIVVHISSDTPQLMFYWEIRKIKILIPPFRAKCI